MAVSAALATRSRAWDWPTRAARLVDYARGAPTGRGRAMRLAPEGRRRLDAADRAMMQVNSMTLQGLPQFTQQELANLLVH
jgi:hypothetical protein